MNILIFGIISILLSIAVNSSLVHSQKTKNLLTNRFGSKAVLFHGAIILPLWAASFSKITYLSLKDGASDNLANLAFSSLIFIASAGLFYLSVAALGWGSLVNYNLFKNNHSTIIKSGIFKYFDNPMYVSFELFFIALGIFTENVYTVLIAGFLFLGLNLIQARFEKP